MLALSSQSWSRESGSKLNCSDSVFDTLLVFFLHQMQEGTIARLTDKGYGFIKRDGEAKDLFFHSNELVGVSYNELREGDRVTFEIADSPKGQNAVKVSKAA